jgi:hypothetical protein
MITEREYYKIVGELIAYEKYRFVDGKIIAEVVNDTIKTINKEILSKSAARL